MQIKKGDKWKAAFVINLGLFKPQVMFFELINSPATFQTMMNEIFATELREGWLSIYMDDILVHTSQDWNKHQECAHRVLTKLKEHNLYLKLEKCQFKQDQVKFLGMILRDGTIQMDPVNVKGVVDWPFPLNVKDMRAFQIYRVLLTLHPQLLQNSKASHRLNQEGHPISLAATTSESIQNTKKHHMQQAHRKTT